VRTQGLEPFGVVNYRHPRNNKAVIVAWIIAVACGAVLIAATLKQILTGSFPFVKPLGSETRDSYLFMVIAAALAIAWIALKSGTWDLTAFDIVGLKGEVVKVQKRVDTLAQQIEQLYGSQQVEVFDNKNWSRLHFKAVKGGYSIDIPLKQDPVPGSINVTRGALTVPSPYFTVKGNHVSFVTYSNSFESDSDSIVVVYQPRPQLPSNATK
jgi:hypothetical protein